MAEYIEREALLDLYADAPDMKFDMMSVPIPVVRQNILDMPAADVVEVKRGRWIWDEQFHDYTCSECHNWDLKTPNYCSNCGADMREVTE